MSVTDISTDDQNHEGQHSESKEDVFSEVAKKRDASEISLPTAKRARVVVDDDTLRVLSESYRAHFAEFSKTRKKVTQLIPNKVWMKIWEDYNQYLDGCEPIDEKALKTRLRSDLINRESRESRRESKDNDDGASSDGDPTIEEIAVLHSIESYAESMATASAKLTNQIEKMNDVLQRRLAEQNLRSQVESMYAAEKLKNVKIGNLHILGQLGILTHDDVVARVKAILSE